MRYSSARDFAHINEAGSLDEAASLFLCAAIFAARQGVDKFGLLLSHLQSVLSDKAWAQAQESGEMPPELDDATWERLWGEYCVQFLRA